MGRGSEQDKNSERENITLSREVKKALTKASHTALSNRQRFIGTEHILYGIITTANKIPRINKKQTEAMIQYLEDMFSDASVSIGILNLAQAIETTIKIAKREEAGKGGASAGKRRFIRVSKTRQKGAFPALEKYCENISAMAEKNQLDPLIEREKELNRIIRALCRRTKNNPLLVGEPGVGKNHASSWIGA